MPRKIRQPPKVKRAPTREQLDWGQPDKKPAPKPGSKAPAKSSVMGDAITRAWNERGLI